MKKIKLHSETVYILGLFIMSLSVAMIACTDYGLSMIVAPAYLLSVKIGVTFGQAEYIVQGLLFIVLCIALRKFRIIYGFSFVTGLIYGAMLDGWRVLIPHFNPEITAPGMLPLPLKLVYFCVGMTLTSFAVALLFRTYLYPQVYDFFVKAISARYKLNRDKFKIGFDISCLVVSCAMTFLLFGKIVGIGVGTLIMTALNGVIIAFFGKLFDKCLEVKPGLSKVAAAFDI